MTIDEREGVIASCEAAWQSIFFIFYLLMWVASPHCVHLAMTLFSLK
jgi:hypothetical protein